MPFVCGTCLARNCSKEEKLEFKTAGEDVLEDVEKFCYLGDMIGCYGGTTEAVSATIGGTWKKFRELSVTLVGKQGLSLKQWVKIYQCSVRPFLWYCRETWELPTVADEARLHGVEPHVIKMMCGVRLVEWVSTDVLHDRIGVAVKIEDMIVQNRLGWSCMETSIPKYVRVWKLKYLGKGRKKGRGK